MCCLQKVRWRGQGALFVGCRSRRYKSWWSGNNDGIEGVGILVKEELCENVVEDRRKSDRVMATVPAFEEEVIRVICAYGPQVGKSDCEKDQIYNDMANEWDLQNPSEVVLGMGDFSGHVEDGLMVLRVCMMGMQLAKEVLREDTFSSFVMERSCAWQIHGLKKRSGEK